MMDDGLIISPTDKAFGNVHVPGDKSICHRALIFSAITDGISEINNFSEGEDNESTARILRLLGVPINPIGPRRLQIHGLGLHGLRRPAQPLDCGNSGTTMRLMAGLLAAQPFNSQLTGDDSLLSRPMKRVILPLREMGAAIEAEREDNYGPLSIYGPRPLHGINYQLPVSSAQIKSCLLLAGIYADGETQITDPGPSRDHTELMMRNYRIKVRRRGSSLVVERQTKELRGRYLDIPGDLSSAAFYLALGAAVKESRVTALQVGINPTRTGVLDAMRQMGVRFELKNQAEMGREPIADIDVFPSELRGTTIGGDLLVRAIDEFPILCVLAAVARGTTTFRDAAELRVKETDRIAAMAAELSKFGVPVEEHPDGLTIHGGAELTGTTCESHGDHRVAMSLAILGCLSSGTTQVLDVGCIATSFPSFRTMLLELTRQELE